MNSSGRLESFPFERRECVSQQRFEEADVDILSFELFVITSMPVFGWSKQTT
jgi:hypothetical protein